MSASCLTEEEIALFAEGKLTPKERKATLKHLEKCPQCSLITSTVALACDLSATGGIRPATATEQTMYYDLAHQLSNENAVTREFKLRLGWDDKSLGAWREKTAAVLREPAVAFMGLNLTEENENRFFPSVNLQVSKETLILRCSMPYPRRMTLSWMGEEHQLTVDKNGMVKIPLPVAFRTDKDGTDPRVNIGVGDTSVPGELEVPVMLS